jgi:hypothetical protein
MPQAVILTYHYWNAADAYEPLCVLSRDECLRQALLLPKPNPEVDCHIFIY